MAAMYPAITPANVEVEYKNVGLGFAGNPDGPDVSALVTVRMRADNPLVFRPITCFVFLCSIDMPRFSRRADPGRRIRGSVELSWRR